MRKTMDYNGHKDMCMVTRTNNKKAENEKNIAH